MSAFFILFFSFPCLEKRLRLRRILLCGASRRLFETPHVQFATATEGSSEVSLSLPPAETGWCRFTREKKHMLASHHCTAPPPPCRAGSLPSRSHSQRAAWGSPRCFSPSVRSLALCVPVTIPVSVPVPAPVPAQFLCLETSSPQREGCAFASSGAGARCSNRFFLEFAPAGADMPPQTSRVEDARPWWVERSVSLAEDRRDALSDQCIASAGEWLDASLESTLRAKAAAAAAQAAGGGGGWQRRRREPQQMEGGSDCGHACDPHSLLRVLLQQLHRRESRWRGKAASTHGSAASKHAALSPASPAFPRVSVTAASTGAVGPRVAPVQDEGSRSVITAISVGIAPSAAAAGGACEEAETEEEGADEERVLRWSRDIPRATLRLARARQVRRAAEAAETDAARRAVAVLREAQGKWWGGGSSAAATAPSTQQPAPTQSGGTALGSAHSPSPPPPLTTGSAAATERKTLYAAVRCAAWWGEVIRALHQARTEEARWMTAMARDRERAAEILCKLVGGSSGNNR